MGELVTSSEKPPHNLLNAGLIGVVVATFILMTTFNALAGSGAVAGGSVFYSTVGDISDKYELLITPAGFTFSIWSVIYSGLAAALLTLGMSIFFTNDHGRIYLNPVIASPSLSIVICVNFILNLVWIFLWDRSFVNANLTVAASVFLFLIAITNWATIAIFARNIAANTDSFPRGDDMFWWAVGYWIMVNIWGIYTAWTTIASLVNLTVALIYVGEVDQRTASLLALSLLVVIHCSWFTVENFLADKYVRFLLTPYLVVIWAANGIWQKILEKNSASDPPRCARRRARLCARDPHHCLPHIRGSVRAGHLQGRQEQTSVQQVTSLDHQ